MLQIKLQRKREKYIIKNQITYIPSRNKNYNSKILKNIISKIEEKDKQLNNLGNPYGLNGKKFYLVKLAITMFFLIASVFNGQSIINIFVISTISFFLLDLLVSIQKKTLYSNITQDLANIVDTVYLQITSNINIREILKKLPELCNTKVFKNALVSMSNVYEYTGFNMQTAVLELKKRFEITEVDMFCNALVEQTMLGDNILLFENLSNLLSQKSLERIKINTKKKVVLITVGIAITLLNITILVFYPIMNSFSQSFSNIFY